MATARRTQRAYVRFSVVLPLIATFVILLATLIPVPKSTRADYVPGLQVRHTYTASFHTTGQSAFAPVQSVQPDDFSFTLVQDDWNESGTSTNIETVLGLSFGGSVSGHTAGQFALETAFRDMDLGTVTVDYPVQIDLTSPAPDSFRPGEVVTFESAWTRLPGASLQRTPFSGAIDIPVTFGLAAGATANLCLFDCTGEFPIAPVFDYNTTPWVDQEPLLPVKDPITNSVWIPAIDSSEPWTIPFLYSFKTGLSGTLGLPNVSTTSRVAGDGVTLIAEGTHENFLDLSLDIDKWVKDITGFPVPFGLSLPGGMFEDVQAGYNLTDLRTNLRMTLHEEFSFTPVVKVTLNFGAPVTYTVRQPNGAFVRSGTSSSATFNAGQKLEVVAPSGVLNVVPTFSIENQFSHSATLTIVNDLTNKELELDLRFPSFEVVPGTPALTEEVCDPIFGTGCTTVTIIPAIPPVNSPSVNVDLGPLYQATLASQTWTDTFLFDGNTAPWQLAGFSSVVGSAVSLNPEFSPTASFTAPASVPEGSSVAFNGSTSSDGDQDPLTYSWSFGDGLTGSGAVPVPHTYADNGAYTATLTVDDGHLIPGSTSRAINVTNMAPTVNAGSNKTVTEGASVGLGIDLFGGNLLANGTAESGLTGWSGVGGIPLASHQPYSPATTPSMADTGLFGSNLVTNPGAEFGTTGWTLAPEEGGTPPITEWVCLPLIGCFWLTVPGAPPTVGGFGSAAYGQGGVDAYTSSPFNVNVVNNGNAESGTAGWTVLEGSLGTYARSALGLPGSGSVFYGGTVPLTRSYQIYSLDSRTRSMANQGLVSYSLSGDFGGWESQNDQAFLRITFLQGGTNIGQVTIGPVTDSDRGNETKMMSRQATGTIPSGTTDVYFYLQQTRTAGTDNDGFADNLSFVMTAAGAAFPTSASPGPSNRGTSFFYGGGQYITSRGSQTIDVSGAAALVDEGDVNFTASAYLGGTAWQEDRAKLTFDFLDSSQARTGLYVLGPATVADRGGVTGLVQRTTTAPVPPGTRSVVITLEMNRLEGNRNDGYADAISFVMNAPPGADLAGIPVGGFPKVNSPGPANRGVEFFTGGNASVASGVQTINVSSGADPIDGGLAQYTLSGYFGGFAAQTDSAFLRATFKNGAGSSLAVVSTSSVTAAQRQGATALLSRTATGPVPVGTRTITVEVVMTRSQGTRNDGYADNLSLILDAPSGASFTDPGVVDKHTASVAWGDGSVTPGVVNQEPGSGSVLGSHVYQDNGVFSPVVSVTDDDGGVGSDGFNITVLNAPPAVTGVDQIFVVNRPTARVVANFADPGTLDTHTAVINWGDGTSTSVGAVTEALGSGTVEGTHTYTLGGPYPRTVTVSITVTDDDGGSQTGYATMTIVDLVIPSVTTSGNVSITEGSSVTLTGSFAAVPDEPTLTYDYFWTFGDGTTTAASPATPGAALSSGPRGFSENGQLPATMTVRAYDAGRLATAESASLMVTVNNAPPVVEAGGNRVVNEGAVVSLAPATFTDAGPVDTHTATVNWGDGAVTAGVLNEAMGTVSASHAYPDNGLYTVTVTVSDDEGASGSDTFTVTVNNVAPAVNAGPNQTAQEGATVSLAPATFTDPGTGDTHTATIDWGDGSGIAVVVVDEVGHTVSGSHTYADNGVYQVMVSVRDDDGATGSGTLQVTVTNVAPTGILSNNGPIAEGSSVTVSFSGQLDPSSTDRTAGLRYAFACNNGSLAGSSYATASITASTSCAFGDNGAYTVRARILDKDNGFSEYQTAVTVNNVAPTLTKTASAVAVDEGQTATNTGAYADTPSDPVTLSASIGAITKTGTSSGTWTWSYTPTDNAPPQTVTITANDGDGGITTTSFTLAIDNVAPTATLSNNGPVNEGASATVSFSSQADPSSVDTTAGLRYAYACDNGPLDGITYATATASATTTCSFADDGAYTVRARILDKDGGFSEYQSIVAVNNVAPVITLSSSALTGTEGVPVGVTGSFSDVAEDPVTFTASIGVVTKTGPSAGTWAWFQTPGDNAPSQTVTVTADDGDGGVTTVSFTLTVENVAPTLTADDTSLTTDEGQMVSTTGTYSDVPGDPVTVTASIGAITKTGTNDGTWSWSYTPTDDAPPQMVTVTADDGDGGITSVSFSLTVNNVAPTITAVFQVAPIPEGSNTTIVAQATDPAGSNDPLTFQFDCDNDGTFETTAPPGTSSAQCFFDDDGDFQVSVRVTDGDGGEAADATIATVNNVAPTAFLPNAGPVGEGSHATLQFGAQFDPSGADTSAGFHYSFACDGLDSSLAASYAAASASSSGACAFGDNGVYAVKGRIFDKDNGSNTYSATVTVNNVAPAVNAGPDGSIDEGSAFASAGSFTDPGADTWTATVDYGDGSGVQPLTLSGKTFALSHVYADNGTYTVTVTVSDDDGGAGSDTALLTVNNVAPAVNAGPDGTIDEGSAFSSAGSFTDPGADTWTATVDYGDGSDVQPLTLSGKTFALSHVYADNGTYTVTVTVTDDDGGAGSDTAVVTVNNVAPTVNAGADQTADEGSIVSLSPATFNDMGTLDTHTATIDWGDGTAADSGVVAESPFGPPGSTAGANGAVSGTHVYADNGSYTVAVCVSDDDGAETCDSLVVTVNNVAPTITSVSQVAQTPEGSNTSIVAQATDPAGSNDPLTFQFDCDNDGTFETTAPPDSSSGQCFFDDNGSFQVNVKVSDGDGGVATGSTVAVVNNVPPTAFLPNAGPVGEGSHATLQFGAQFDPSGADTSAGFHYSFACDGLDSSLATSYAAAGASSSGACAFGDNGVYAVKGRIFDKDNGSNTYSATVTVNNVAPVVNAGPDGSINEGSAFASAGSFTDPGADTWTATVDYGDGSGVQPLALNPDKSFALSHAYVDNGTYTVTVTVTDDDGGAGSDTAVVTVNNVAPSLTLDTTGAIAFSGGSAFVGRKGVQQSHSASATDVGSDDLTFGWAFPPNPYTEAATYYNNGASPDPLPSPAGVFPFGATDSASVTFSAPGVYTVSVQVVDDDGGSDAASLSKLVTGDRECAKTQGYWRHQFSGKGKQQIDNATLQAYLNIVGFASGVFSESVQASTLAQAQAVFLPGGDDDDDDDGPSNMREKANAQALAAWLNFASGAVGWNELITIHEDDDDHHGPTVTMTFSAAMAQVEAILLNPGATHAQLVKAKSIAASINEMDEHSGACRDDDRDDDDKDDKGSGSSGDKKDDGKGGKDNGSGNGGSSGDKKDDGKKPVAAPPSGSTGKGKGK